ncbi:hypothetical protein DJ564_07040 [Pseudomonas sp. 31-12]|uniref:hypothetical protein n=1 Tax=Pseudomonas sp. 31-12 TaxID=2201356 RepID=UPI000D6C994D|nr:hypothetical protein [Pseudomonas sp. 31-12]AWM90596.1 hypothetical protein DJ564_07040 [Pseudomonas sp. 31-12]
MDVINVQFDSEERKVVVAEFSSVQDTSFWPNQGAVSIDDERYKDFKEKTRSNISSAPSTSTPALKRAFSFLRS